MHARENHRPTDEEMEVITFTINLIFSGNFESIDENLAVIRIFTETLGRR